MLAAVATLYGEPKQTVRLTRQLIAWFLKRVRSRVAFPAENKADCVLKMPHTTESQRAVFIDGVGGEFVVC